MRSVLVFLFIGVVGVAAAMARAAAREAELAVTPQLQDVLAANWRDGQIRTEVISGTRETEISLGLLPSGQYGTLTLVFSARLPKSASAEPPGTVQIRIGAGLNVNPNAVRRLVLRFILDPKTSQATTIDASDRLRILDLDPSASLDNASAVITLVEFIQLLRADVITGQILGLDVSLTSKQREALRDFGTRVLPPLR